MKPTTWPEVESLVDGIKKEISETEMKLKECSDSNYRVEILEAFFEHIKEWMGVA